MAAALEELQAKVAATKRELSAASTLDSIAQLKAKALGGSGYLRQALSSVCELPPEERPEFGQQVNALKQELSDAFAAREAEDAIFGADTP